MAILTPSLALATAQLSAIRTQLNAGGAGNPALVDVYSGTKPARPDTAITNQVLLGTLTCADDCGSVSTIDGVPTLTFATIAQDAEADASGVASWGRIRSTGAGAAAVLDFDITSQSGSGFAKMNTTNIVAGGPISAISFVITA